MLKAMMSLEGTSTMLKYAWILKPCPDGQLAPFGLAVVNSKQLIVVPGDTCLNQ